MKARWRGAAGGVDLPGVLRQPPGLGDEHLVHHLPDLRRIADRANQRVEQDGLLQQFNVAGDGRLRRHALHLDGVVADRRAAEGQIADDGD